MDHGPGRGRGHGVSATDARFRHAGGAGQWREVLTKEQIAAIVTPNREQMARFGYLLD